MAWFHDQPVETEGFDTLQMMNVLQVWLPITFSTPTVHPPAEQKLYAVLTAAQRAKLATPGEAVLAAEYTLKANNRDTLKSVLNLDPGFGLGFFRATIGPALKFILPAGWVASAVAMSVKTLVGYLLDIDQTKESAAYLSANLAVGGVLRELWHTLEIAPGSIYFYRVIQYEVQIGKETRQFVLLSTRYALAP
jgi:hypothetical protein